LIALDLEMECSIHFSFSMAAFLEWTFLRLMAAESHEEIRTCSPQNHRRLVSLERSELGLDGAWDLRGFLFPILRVNRSCSYLVASLWSVS
jgi:hypothetical protein